MCRLVGIQRQCPYSAGYFSPRLWRRSRWFRGECLYSAGMKQIRIVRTGGIGMTDGRRFACEWMEASLNNRWFLRTRLDEALRVHGHGTHRIEIRDKQTAAVTSDSGRASVVASNEQREPREIV